MVERRFRISSRSRVTYKEGAVVLAFRPGDESEALKSSEGCPAAYRYGVLGTPLQPAATYAAAGQRHVMSGQSSN